jgi:hypothetical protein
MATLTELVASRMTPEVIQKLAGLAGLSPDRVAAEVRSFLAQYKERATAGAEGGGSGARGDHGRLVGHLCWRSR